VILLVGAFDPLDEQEAQRVGADGVLKKPFVPPDPLISMVKSALVRAGVAHAGFTPVKPVPEAPAEIPAPPAPSPNFAPKPAATLPDFNESFVDDVPAPPAALKIDSGQQPVAFGNLLETGTNTEEEPSEVTAIPALERDWRAADVDEEEEEEEVDAKASWRRDAGSEEREDGVAASDTEWGDAGAEESRRLGKKHSGWTPTREKGDLTGTAEVPENVHSSLSDFRNIPSAPFSGEAWAAAIEAGVQNKTAVAEEEHPVPRTADLETLVGRAAEPAAHEMRAEEGFVAEPVSVPQPSPLSESVEPAPVASTQVEATAVEDVAVVSASVAKLEQASVTPSWFSTPPNPWDVEAQRASKLASTWDAPSPTAATSQVAAKVSVPETIEATNSFATAAAPDEIEVVSGVDASSVIPEAVATAREEVSHGATELDMDAVVARVLARMSPDRLQEVARDVLKPVIESIVREELNKRS
jgi:hypothetical protein